MKGCPVLHLSSALRPAVDRTPPHRPVRRGAGDAYGRGHLGGGASGGQQATGGGQQGTGGGQQGTGGGQLRRGHQRRAPTAPAAGHRCLQTCGGALFQEVALELAQRAEEVQDQAPGGGGGVDGLRQGAEAHSPAVQLVDELQEVAKGAGQAVQAPDGQHVPGTQTGQDVVQGRAGRQGAGGGVGPGALAARCREGVVLQGGVLRGGRDAGVAQQVTGPLAGV